MARRFVQSAVAVVLAALVIFGAAGIASAAFTSKSTASLTASTLTLQPPTVSRQTCESGFLNKYPVVTFTASPSVGVISRAGKTFAYKVVYQNDGLTGRSGTEFPTSSETQWTGPGHLFPATWTVTIATTYGTWTSAPATVSCTC